MSKWQHFLHAFGIHDWHYIRRFKVDGKRTGHGPHVPTEYFYLFVRLCCHCGTEQHINPERALSVSAWISAEREIERREKESE